MANAWIIKPLAFTASSAQTAVGSPDNLSLDYAGIIWRSNATAGPSLAVDLGRDVAIDSVMLFGIALAASNPTWTIAASSEAEGTAAGGFAGYARITDSAALLAGSEMPVSGQGVAMAALPAGWPPVRYLRLTFAAPVSAIQLSRLVIGKRLTLDRNFAMGGNFGVRDLGSVDFSARGVLMRRRGAKLRTASLTFSNLRKDEVEAQTKPLLEQVGNTEMIALVTDPAEHPQRQNRAYFGPLVGDLSHAQRNSAGWETKVNVASIF